jgi:hypothetical protein
MPRRRPALKADSTRIKTASAPPPESARARFRSLGGDMSASDELNAAQWFLFGKSFADETKNRHFTFSPFNSLLAMT